MNRTNPRKELSHSLWIAWKDLVEFRRNRMGLFMLVLMPVFMMVMTGFIFPSGNVLNRVPVALVNLDEGSEGLNLVSQLETINGESALMELMSAHSFQETKQMILDGEVVGGIVVPEGFSSALSNGEQGSIILVTDQSNPQIAATLSTVLEEVIDGIGATRAAGVVAGLAQQANVTLTALAVVVPYRIESRGVVEGSTSYFDFVAPGIMAMVVMLSVMTGLPRAISYEKDIGTLDGFL
ncbi:MAG: YhgE/Pip domain-containing protein, partial [Candidatus Geothermarchaeales archaeon]